jgi:hypothetical protein
VCLVALWVLLLGRCLCCGMWVCVVAVGYVVLFVCSPLLLMKWYTALLRVQEFFLWYMLSGFIRLSVLLVDWWCTVVQVTAIISENFPSWRGIKERKITFEILYLLSWEKWARKEKRGRKISLNSIIEALFHNRSDMPFTYIGCSSVPNKSHLLHNLRIVHIFKLTFFKHLMTLKGLLM